MQLRGAHMPPVSTCKCYNRYISPFLYMNCHTRRILSLALALTIFFEHTRFLAFPVQLVYAKSLQTMTKKGFSKEKRIAKSRSDTANTKKKMAQRKAQKKTLKNGQKVTKQLIKGKSTAKEGKGAQLKGKGMEKRPQQRADSASKSPAPLSVTQKVTDTALVAEIQTNLTNTLVFVKNAEVVRATLMQKLQEYPFLGYAPVVKIAQVQTMKGFGYDRPVGENISCSHVFSGFRPPDLSVAHDANAATVATAECTMTNDLLRCPVAEGGEVIWDPTARRLTYRKGSVVNAIFAEGSSFPISVTVDRGNTGKPDTVMENPDGNDVLDIVRDEGIQNGTKKLMVTTENVDGKLEWDRWSLRAGACGATYVNTNNSGGFERVVIYRDDVPVGAAVDLSRSGTFPLSEIFVVKRDGSFAVPDRKVWEFLEIAANEGDTIEDVVRAWLKERDAKKNAVPAVGGGGGTTTSGGGTTSGWSSGGGGAAGGFYMSPTSPSSGDIMREYSPQDSPFYAP